MGSAAGKRSSAEPTLKKSQHPGQSQWTASGSQIVRAHRKEKGSGVGVGRTSDRGAWPGRRRGGRGGLVAAAGQAVRQTRTPPVSGGVRPPRAAAAPILAPAPPIRPRPSYLRTPGSARGTLDPGRVARAPPCGQPAPPLPGTRANKRRHSGASPGPGTPAAGTGWAPTCLRLLSDQQSEQLLVRVSDPTTPQKLNRGTKESQGQLLAPLGQVTKHRDKQTSPQAQWGRCLELLQYFT